MTHTVPLIKLLALIQPHARGALQMLMGRPPFLADLMLRIPKPAAAANLRDPAMEKELHDQPMYRESSGLAGAPRFPDVTTILRFGHPLNKHKLAQKAKELINSSWKHTGLLPKTNTLVDANLIAALRSTKNQNDYHDPAKREAKMGNQFHFIIVGHNVVAAVLRRCTASSAWLTMLFTLSNS